MNRFTLLRHPATLLGLLAVMACPRPLPAADTKASSRTFDFTYQATVTGLPAGKVARAWLPVPPVTAEQAAEVVSKSLPAVSDLLKYEVNRDPTYGNLILYVEARADRDGKVPLRLTYRVTRREVKAGREGIPGVEAQERIARFLQPDANVPVKGKPVEQIEDKLIKDMAVPMDQLEAGRLFYNAVNKHMKYDKSGQGWGRGDAVWACANGRGNCSDFHSLFISLARAHQIPAKFEIGFPLPEKHGAGDIPGYHCWAWFRPRDRGWVPVDISEANKNPKMTAYFFGNLTPDRVQFSTGRDITLVPRQAGAPLNFFIYPYVEVDGKAYDKVDKKFSYKDVPADKG